MNEQEINSLRLGIEAYDRGDYTLAFPLLLKAAEAGDREAQFRCGDLYQDEEKSGQFDKEKAMYWYEKAAKQGHVEAQRRYGLAYYIGWGEDGITDKEEAFYWYGKAAEQGHAEAQYHYGSMYEYGNGTEEDLEKAVYWYKKAARQGNTDAMCQIGFVYEVEMEPADLNKALYWYEMAAAEGNEEALFSCSQLRDQMDIPDPESEGTIGPWEISKIRQRDPETIRKWEDKAGQGDPEAAYLCALFYLYEKKTKNRS